MDKINVSELLKGCPSGLELDCTCADNVIFDKIIEYEQIKCVIGECRDPLILDKYGRLLHICCPKCVIFPKGKTTWEGFHRPFNEGDIIADEHGNIAIYKGEMRHNKKLADYYCGYRNTDCKFLVKKDIEGHFGRIEEKHLATEEEKSKLFDAIKDNGYKWNEETKTLEKLGKLKFKVGDRIRHKENGNILKIVEIDMSDSTYCCGLDYVWVADQDNYELVPDKFDINTLKPFDKVLVRDFDNTPWEIEFFSRLLDGKHFKCSGLSYVQCIPYKGNEHLNGKKDDCDKYFKTWE